MEGKSKEKKNGRVHVTKVRGNKNWKKGVCRMETGEK
jgi:hypothetical protein